MLLPVMVIKVIKVIFYFLVYFYMYYDFTVPLQFNTSQPGGRSRPTTPEQQAVSISSGSSAKPRPHPHLGPCIERVQGRSVQLLRLLIRCNRLRNPRRQRTRARRIA